MTATELAIAASEAEMPVDSLHACFTAGGPRAAGTGPD